LAEERGSWVLSVAAISNFRETAARCLDLDQACIDQKAIFLQLPVAARLPVFITNLQMPWTRPKTAPLQHPAAHSKPKYS
jgi:hypothetical protein